MSMQRNQGTEEAREAGGNGFGLAICVMVLALVVWALGRGIVR